MPEPAVGLCRDCRWRQRVPNRRGSVFWLCQRSKLDPAWPRYPRLPVLECSGHEPGEPVTIKPVTSG